MSFKSKSLIDKAIDALNTRDEKAAAERAQAQAEAAQKESAVLRITMKENTAAAARAAAEQAAAARIAAEKAVAERVAAAKAAAESAASAGIRKGIVTIPSLRVRKDHTIVAEIVAGLVDGTEISILETWSNGRDTWARLDNGWAAVTYNGETYISFVS
jgi:ATPase subunit of ABC transporter with duplicated ATPase domains